MKKFTSTVRVVVAVVMAFVITQAFNLWTPLTALCRGVLGLEAFTIFQWWWSWAVHHIVVRGCLGARLEVCPGSLMPKPEEGVQDIFIVNHTPTPLLPSLFYYVRANYSKRLMAVVKIELVRNLAWGLFIGFAMWSMWGAVFIDRNNTKQAFAAVRYAVQRFAGRMPFFIFPDMSRPTPEKIAADRDKYRKTIPNIDAWLTRTLLPRTGGTFQQIKAIDELFRPNGERYKIRLIVVTCWSSRPSQSVAESAALINSRLFVNVFSIDDAHVPRTVEGLTELFNTIWMWINSIIESAEEAAD